MNLQWDIIAIRNISKGKAKKKHIVDNELSLLLLFMNWVNILNRILNFKTPLEKQNISFSWTLIHEKYYLKNSCLVFK
jgi:hypothetical protein